MPIRTLSIGGATYDLFLKLNPDAEKDALQGKRIGFDVGKKVRIQRVIESCGGGANNTAVGLARLGCAASFCGVVGEDQWGQRLLDNLKREGVDVSPATVVEKETSSFSIVLSLEGGERTILYTPGVNEHLHDVTFDKEAVEKADCVYLNRLSEGACEIEDDIIGMLAKHEDIRLTWNPGGCQLEAGMHARDKAALLARTHLLLLNKEEALMFTGTKTVKDALKALVGTGVTYACITDGGNGVMASGADAMYFCPPMKDVAIVETTGAGDAFGTGATWALLCGESLPTALIAGTLNATSVIGVIGAQAGLLTETQMRSRLKQHSLTVELVQ